MSDTPRTDAEAGHYDDYFTPDVVSRDFARQLERELIALQHDISRHIQIAVEAEERAASLQADAAYTHAMKRAAEIAAKYSGSAAAAIEREAKCPPNS